MRRKALLAVVAAALFMAGCAGTTEGSAPQAEGIVVHGDWKLDVYDADGTFDRTIEFHNEVVASGLETVAEVLSGERRIANWAFDVYSETAADGPCGGICAEPLTPTTADGVLTLEGTVIADQDGEIGQVQAVTLSLECEPGVAECPSAPAGSRLFSSKSIRDGDGAQYIVTAGQSIQVSIEFTFTSG